MTDTFIANELDYKKSNYSYPVYRHSKILPQSGQQTLTVTNAGGAETLFELPTKVFNLSHSYLDFGIAPSAADISGGFVMHRDLLPTIRQLQLYTRGGLFLCDINNFDNYTKVVLKPETSLEEFLTYETMAHNIGYGEGFQPARSNAATRPEGNNINVPFDEPLYITIGSNQTASPSLSFKIPLSLIKNSIFNVDHDLFFDEVVVLRVIWNAPSKYMWRVPNVGAITTTPTPYAGNVSLTNLACYLAVETNQDIAQQIIAKKNSPEGLSVLLPYVYSNKINLTGTSQSISLKYNRAHGMKLMKIYHQPIGNNETIFGAYQLTTVDASGIINAVGNISGQIINNFYTLLNNNRLQEFNVDCTKLEDHMLLKHKFRGSVVLNSNVYQYNWFWCDDFSNDPAPLHAVSMTNKDNLMRGLDLSSEQKWDIYISLPTSAQLNHYTFSITQKMLVVNSAGIQIL